MDNKDQLNQTPETETNIQDENSTKAENLTEAISETKTNTSAEDKQEKTTSKSSDSQDIEETIIKEEPNSEDKESNLEKNPLKLDLSGIAEIVKLSTSKTFTKIKEVETLNESTISTETQLDIKKEKSEPIDEVAQLVDSIGVKEKDSEIEDIESLSREELVQHLEECVKEENINSVKSKISSIKVAFIKLDKEDKANILKKFLDEGGKEEEFEPVKDEIQIRFQVAFQTYKEKRIKHNEEQEKIKLINLEKKKEILDELKQFINSEENLKKTYDDFKLLQERWKEIGMVPKAEANNLWQSYHFLVDKFFDKVKINKELRDLDLKKNLELKIELCEKVEELLLETSITKSFKLLQKYHEEWKEAGAVPMDKKDEIWERFKSATVKINKKRKEYYDNIHVQQEKNLEAKTALCEKMEEITSGEIDRIKDYQVKTEEVNELLKIWKTLGPAPKKNNDEIWERFKSSINSFYDNKKEYFNTLKEEQTNNYNIKLDICVQSEALKTSTNWKKTTADLIKLQEEWKNIGPVPKKHSDKIWKRFRAACDEFFNAKSDYFSNIHEHEEKNMNLKLELIQKVKGYEFSDDKSKNLEVLKEFQREWMEIGHVPIKEKNKLQEDFRETVNAKLDKLNISSAEINTVNYRQRMENAKDSPDAKRAFQKEKSFVQNKISNISADINLWENNIGFLANSKKADVLKEEFEKKIQTAKSEILVLKAKLKYLNEEMDK